MDMLPKPKYSHLRNESYMGCVEVLQSMRVLDFNTRTQVTREAISVVCEAVPGAKGALRRRKPSTRSLSSILGKSNLQFAGMSINLSVSTSSLNLMATDCKQIIANHHMQSISFASGGDPVSIAFLIIYLIINVLRLEMAPFDGSAWDEEEEEQPPPDIQYYNDFPGKDPPLGGLVDMRGPRSAPTGATLGSGWLVYSSNGCVAEPFEDALRVPAAPPMEEQLRRELWFHGKASRKEAEKLLQGNGDFLVRESTTTPGQYVLTGLQGGHPKHLLLVDPEGVVSPFVCVRVCVCGSLCLSWFDTVAVCV
ncbi:UNVERIFIED_CONTAM: hypothetical protein FKN15_068624 [Acipenser sinensis]